MNKGRIDKVERLFLWVGYAALVAMTVLIFFNVIFRYFLKFPIPGVIDVTQEYLMPMYVFLTMGYVYSSGGFVRVTMLTRKFSEKVNKVVMSVFDFLAFILYLLIAYVMFKKTIDAFSIGEFSASKLAYPMAPAYALVALGALYLSYRLLMSAVTGRHPDDIQVELDIG